MPKFSVYGVVPASKYLGDFEADTKEEAEEMALSSDENHLSVVHDGCNFELDDISCSQAVAQEIVSLSD